MTPNTDTEDSNTLKNNPAEYTIKTVAFISSGPVSDQNAVTLRKIDDATLSIDYSKSIFSIKVDNNIISSGNITKWYSERKENPAVTDSCGFMDAYGKVYMFSGNGKIYPSSVTGSDLLTFRTTNGMAWFDNQPWTFIHPLAIYKWEINGYFQGDGYWPKSTPLGKVTLYINYHDRTYSIHRPDGITETGNILTYYGGNIGNGIALLGAMGFLNDKGNIYIFTNVGSNYEQGGVKFKGTPGPGTPAESLSIQYYYPDGNPGPSAQSYPDGYIVPNTNVGGAVAPTIVADVCFLAGTLLCTPEGERKVEDLRVGDHISVWFPTGKCVKKIIWIGCGYTEVKKEYNCPDEAGYPICFRAGSISENIPHTDLYVTPDHCMYFDGYFVPSRMLVNDANIIYEQERTKYQYFHIELAEHSVLIANGALSESYLDTGNRSNFKSARHANALIPTNAVKSSWNNDSFAPLNVARSFVEPLWNRLFARSGVKKREKVFIKEFDIKLNIGNNSVLIPSVVRDNTYSFRIPFGTREIKIYSNRVRPCDQIGVYLDDRRWFGILISEISISNAENFIKFDLEDIAIRSSGWHRQPIGGAFWTDGDAYLNVPRLDNLEKRNFFLLNIQVESGGPYTHRRCVETKQDPNTPVLTFTIE